MNNEVISSINMQDVHTYLTDLQLKITHELEAVCTSKFSQEILTNNNSKNIIHVINQDQTIEKGAINYSQIQAAALPKSANLQRPGLENASFQASGLSMIFHPLNPFAPTMHANLRVFLAEKTDGEVVWWFGGGMDLTPTYGFEEDCIHWHQTCKQACDPYGKDLYPKFKQACDAYFFNKYRKEPRGIGGLFFDDFNDFPFEQCVDFMRSIGDHIIPAYLPILKRRTSMPYQQKHTDYQHYRRGRYVEYNLLLDRGTRFGLEYGTRIESLLASMPPHASWRYNYMPAPNSDEEKLVNFYLVPRDWLMKTKTLNHV